MGDRANVIIKGDDAADIVLYTHWNGYQVTDLVKAGIREVFAAGRLGDDDYSRRIIVQTFFDAHNDPYTGVGLTAGVQAWEDKVVIVDLEQASMTTPEGDIITFANLRNKESV